MVSSCWSLQGVQVTFYEWGDVKMYDLCLLSYTGLGKTSEKTKKSFDICQTLGGEPPFVKVLPKKKSKKGP